MAGTADNPFAPGDEPAPTPREAVRLDIGPILSRCWELFTDNPMVVLGAILIPFAVSLGFTGVDTVLQVMAEQAGSSDAALPFLLGGFVVNLLSWLVQIFFALGVARLFLSLARGEHADLGQLVGEGDKWLSGVAASFLVGLGTVIGLILLIVPGIIFSLGMYVFLYAIVDRNLGPVEAMQESWRLTDGSKMTLFLLSLVIGLGVVVLAVVTCGIGLLVAVPVLSLVQAVVYQSLVAQKEALEATW